MWGTHVCAELNARNANAGPSTRLGMPGLAQDNRGIFKANFGAGFQGLDETSVGRETHATAGLETGGT